MKREGGKMVFVLHFLNVAVLCYLFKPIFHSITSAKIMNFPMANDLYNI